MSELSSRTTYSRRFLLSASLSALVTGAYAEAPTRSYRPQARPKGIARGQAPAAERLLGQSGLSGNVVFAVADAKTGLRLEGHQPETSVPPASVAKAITALYALDTLGAEYRFATQVLSTTPMQNGVVAGDLVLVGGGDPVLDTSHLADLAAQLKNAGLREVRGNFIVYEGAMPYVRSIDPGQPDHVGYSPAISGIALNFNRVHFEWRKGSNGYQVSMDARSGTLRPDVRMAKMRVANRGAPVYAYEDSNGVDNWSVARSALGGSGARWLPVRKPALYAGDVFRVLARSQGIQLQAPQTSRQTPRGTVLAQHRSIPLKDILRDMLKFSTNSTAEIVGLAATAARSGVPASLQASADQMNEWAGRALGMGSVRLVDHSGLGDASRVRANEMVAALVKVHGNQTLRPILREFSMRDADNRVIPNHPIDVDAKTGTLNFVSGLAGYMTAPDGTELAFAIFAADKAARARISRAERESPPGASAWNRRAKRLQQRLIERWGTVYGS